jgi:hypothetical protein
MTYTIKEYSTKDTTRSVAQQEVYFVQAKELKLIKIGISANPRLRLSDMQVGSPDKLEILLTLFIVGQTACMAEHNLHLKFKDCNAHNEWFQPSSELLAFIEEHKQWLVEGPRAFTFKRVKEFKTLRSKRTQSIQEPRHEQ